MPSDGDGIYLGSYWNEETGQVGKEIVYQGDRHGILFGPTGAGKGIRFLMVNLLGDYLAGRSVIVVDPKAELAAVTALQRYRLHGPGSVKIIDPFGKLHEVIGNSPAHRELAKLNLVDSTGFNPLLNLDHQNPTFYDDADAIADALIQISPMAHEPHWAESARKLVTGLVMWEVIKAEEEQRVPSLANVRMKLTEPEFFPVDAEGKRSAFPTKGLSVTAVDMVATERYELVSLGGRFIQKNREVESIISTADTQLGWLLSSPMRKDLARTSAINFNELKETPITVYVILPAEYMRLHSSWLRLVLVTALRALYRAGGVRTVILIDEMATLGHLAPIEDAFGLVRGYGVQIVAIVQDLTQLKELYQNRWESFIANAGFVQGFRPNDLTTADWMSRRSHQTTIVVRGVTEGTNVGGKNESWNRGESWSQSPQMLYMPYDLMRMRRGAGVLWLADLADTVPFFGEIYSKMNVYRRRALPNPYYSG